MQVCPHMPSLGVSSLDLKAAERRPPFFREPFATALAVLTARFNGKRSVGQSRSDRRDRWSPSTSGPQGGQHLLRQRPDRVQVYGPKVAGITPPLAPRTRQQSEAGRFASALFRFALEEAKAVAEGIGAERRRSMIGVPAY